mgnify:CR=1 FL=1
MAIIPARGGSKRIPRKNIKDFLGKPIIAFSIEVALKSGLFDEVMVSTDDEEIADIARQYGASVPFMRSYKNSNDFATTVGVLKEVELDYKQKLKKDFDFICCIYPTAPLIDKKHLIDGYYKLLEEKLDVVFPIVPFSYPIWRGVEIVNDVTKMVWEEHLNSRSQDLKQVYHDAGQWYWYNPTRLEDNLFTGKASSIILTEDVVQDIDNLTDWKLAEIKFQLLHEK